MHHWCAGCVEHLQRIVSPRVGHFPPQVRIAGWRQFIEDPQRLVPPPVEGKAAEPGQPRRDARTKGAAGASQRRLRLGCKPTPGGGLGRAIRQCYVAHLPEERECHQGVVVIFREQFTGPRPRPVRRVGSTHGRVNDAQPVIGERGASGHSSPRPRFVDERDELFVHVNRRAQVSGSGWVPAVGALPKVEPGGKDPRIARSSSVASIEDVVGRKMSNHAWIAADICAATNGVASSAARPRSISAQPARNRSE